MLRKIGIERNLSKEESNLIKTLIRNTYKESEIVAGLKDYKVKDMDDGGMGSLKFIYKDQSQEPQVMGSTLAGGRFFDVDGVLVTVTINLNKAEQMYELDIWKADFSPLLQYPKDEDIILSKANYNFTLRNLKPEEKTLIETLAIGTSKESEIITNLSTYTVMDMRDGSMGSLWFAGKNRLEQFLDLFCRKVFF